MSEWYTCPRCGATRESICACENPSCPDFNPGDPLPKPWAVYAKRVLKVGDVISGNWHRVTAFDDRSVAEGYAREWQTSHPSQWAFAGINTGPTICYVRSR